MFAHNSGRHRFVVCLNFPNKFLELKRPLAPINRHHLDTWHQAMRHSTMATWQVSSRIEFSFSHSILFHFVNFRRHAQHFSRLCLNSSTWIFSPKQIFHLISFILISILIHQPNEFLLVLPNPKVLPSSSLLPPIPQPLFQAFIRIWTFVSFFVTPSLDIPVEWGLQCRHVPFAIQEGRK